MLLSVQLRSFTKCLADAPRNQAFKDLDSTAGPDTLIIHGMNFTSGEHDPIVTLHNVGVLSVPVGGVTEDTVTAELPGVVTPGDYLLSISTSPAVVDNDTYALTIGGGSSDSSGLQQRIVGVCAQGWAIRVVNEDGSVVCEPDDDTTYTNGFGLNLFGNVFSVDSVEFQRRVFASCPAGSAIRAISEDGDVLCEQVSP